MDTNNLAVKLAAIKAVSDAVKLAEADVKDHLRDAMAPGDRKQATTADGEDVATISFSKSSASARVTDPVAFTKWVAETHPQEVHRPITVDADDLPPF